jgi:hypothetical protein
MHTIAERRLRAPASPEVMTHRKTDQARSLRPAAFDQTESFLCDLQDRHEKADFFVDFCRRRHRFRNFLAQDVTVLPAQSVQRHP